MKRDSKIALSCVMALILLPVAAATAQETTTRPAAPPAVHATPDANPTPTPPEMRSAPSLAAPDANKGGTAASDANETRRSGGWQDFFSGSNGFLFLMIGLVILMVIMSGRTRRKEARKRADMLSGMKKGDRVTTIGGVIGTLIEVREHDVVVKVDEQNNTRMRFARSAIHSIGEQPADKTEQK
jgi:preprotein translocase subunit YajC